ncbi:hypothetical protein NEF87_001740 [Candidatus Lokiarchaeum ossiferum]|uniref:DUF4177 domain-containing protein n=1 Tax=Candidatus Lokiarchaeum ossiferum TaxID=2951803 RepID=A0ABY6HPW7_9ARCH|nr:hypothetical protein NEF87_001740 [Candidatus Lokiarchaeum sp. B-35]
MTKNASDQSKFIYYEYSLQKDQKKSTIIQNIETMGWKFQQCIVPEHLKNTVGYVFTKPKIVSQ